ncbi:potassium channel family protein [Antiquaquibacter oligotrophicus]|nr:potassium channel family protein [Antiquaquibacter oligotrophicus]UDF14063.1 potassium channel family protein [Antiquaquibacter oligotrophicus]
MDRAEQRIAFRQRWEAATTIPLIVLGGLFVITYSVYAIIADLPPLLLAIVVLELVVVWIVFLGDYLVRLFVTPRGHRWAFVRANVVDLLSVAFPLFRGFRVINLLAKVPYLSGRSGTQVRTRIVVYLGAYAIFFVYFIALAVLLAERGADGATIHDFGDAIWWACVTVATVGYGDMYPVTLLGRTWAVVLMAGGIAIIGTASAVVVSYVGELVGKHRPS